MTKSDIENDFGRIWPAHVENFTWLLIQCRRHFDGDLDRLLVLSVIGDRTMAAKNVPKNFTVQDLGTLKAKIKSRESPSICNLSQISAEFPGRPFAGSCGI